MKTHAPYMQVGLDMQFLLETNISVLSCVQAFTNNANQKLLIFCSPFFFQIKEIQSSILELIIAVKFCSKHF